MFNVKDMPPTTQSNCTNSCLQHFR